MPTGWENRPYANLERLDVSEFNPLQFFALDQFMHVPVGHHRNTCARDAGCANGIDSAGRQGTADPDPIQLAISHERPGAHGVKFDARMPHQVARRRWRSYERFARGGFGTVITEGIYTDQAYSQAYVHQPVMTDGAQANAWKPAFAANHRSLMHLAKRYAAKAKIFANGSAAP